MDLPGIRYLPGQGWFWQQNSEGRYMDALRLITEVDNSGDVRR
ncbi:putative cytoplasmic protein [Salmonella enterica subsp. enterica serovar Gaminara str. A4-567]|nr:putative cytoplasmic protein [Salmonella enterica subsp. enterica serovar Gaminara str. A4-567]